LKSQIEHQVFDLSCAELFDLRSAVIGVPHGLTDLRDLRIYSFDPNAVVSWEPFVDIVGRHFKQPKEGLGFDNSATGHMWRSIRRSTKYL
jgi:hypothetical protein